MRADFQNQLDQLKRDFALLLREIQAMKQGVVELKHALDEHHRILTTINSVLESSAGEP